MKISIGSYIRKFSLSLPCISTATITINGKKYFEDQLIFGVTPDSPYYSIVASLRLLGPIIIVVILAGIIYFFLLKKLNKRKILRIIVSILSVVFLILCYIVINSILQPVNFNC